MGSIYTRDKRKVWSCQNCNWIHQKSVVDEIFTLIRDRYKPQTIKPKAENSKTGVIILSHGSKLKNANNTMFTIVNTVKKELGLKNILSAYLQFHQPDLAKTVRRLAAKGCKKIIIVPFFLFKGNHVSLDVPKAIKEEKAKHPQVNFIYTHNLGPDTRLSEIVINRISEAIKCTQKK
ncbi:MAG: CbiX/SirB N-terminal domain-containing protein [Candidatus Omnitrophota bacterium]|nr:CbiX/SirB N-terminal domain-containing protein [Candidatus Omnitrophota bacterium]